ncbi:hypothetical protein CGLAMM_02715 [Acetobacteraceae bacterium EV16G]|uniref:Uncharacterized protein n=1 Tax=Sorlinia euscelidii TaxID=3081148 RepID=A0ABU7U2G8_9PROT
MAETITVICRLPSGIRLDVHDMEVLKARNLSPNQSNTAPKPMKSVTLNGIKGDPRFVKEANVHLGYGGRTQVDKEFWEAWLKQNASSDLVKKNIIFAEVNEKRALDRLDSEGKTPTGMEPLDQNKVPGVKKASDK